AVLSAFSAGPVLAQDTARQHQLELAGRYLELTSVGDSAKMVREQLEAEYAEADLPTDQRAWLTDQMTAMFEDVMALTIADVRDDVADTFTVAELEAAVAFYETPMGRSISSKNIEIGMAIQEAMAPHLTSRITAMSQKFCQRFDCAAMGQSAAKSGR
ncbi:MAG: DUF2059 domain-containing protein, partial [Caulobacteraceae bacterium]